MKKVTWLVWKLSQKIKCHQYLLDRRLQGSDRSHVSDHSVTNNTRDGKNSPTYIYHQVVAFLKTFTYVNLFLTLYSCASSSKRLYWML